MFLFQTKYNTIMYAHGSLTGIVKFQTLYITKALQFNDTIVIAISSNHPTIREREKSLSPPPSPRLYAKGTTFTLHFSYIFIDNFLAHMNMLDVGCCLTLIHIF